MNVIKIELAKGLENIPGRTGHPAEGLCGGAGLSAGI